MQRKPLLLLLFAFACLGLWALFIPSWTKSRPGRESASAAQAPWVVALTAYTSKGDALCSGSHVAPRWILTAAHCVVHKDILVQSSVQVAAQRLKGMPSSLPREKQSQMKGHAAWAGQIFSYPGAQDYDWSKMDVDKLPVDLALIRLETPLQSPTINLGSPASSVSITYHSWGYGLPEQPQDDFVLYKTKAHPWRCQEGDQPWICVTGSSKNTHQICQGDSGGPLVASANSQNSVVGVASHGMGILELVNHCTPLGIASWIGLETYFTPVQDHLAWIKDTIQSNS